MSGEITPFGAEPSSLPRVAFFAHDSQGLGHIRRVLALAGELARRRPDARMLALTSSFFGGVWSTPERLDLIKLPSQSRLRVYQHDPNAQHSARERAPLFYGLREVLIQRVIDAFAPRLFVVDNQPMGLLASRELVAPLEQMRRAGSARLVLGLRDIFDTPEWVRQPWFHQEITRLLREVYDQVLVYGDRSVFDVVREYDFPAAVAEKVVYTGYIRKREPLTPAAELRAQLGAEDRPLVVVTSGSGFDGAALEQAYVAALAQGLLPDVASFVVAGPLMAERERALLLQAAHRPATRIVAFDDQLTSWINAADLVVSMAGYNSVTEAVGFGKRLVLVPRPGPGEQLIRATLFAERGLSSLLSPDALSPKALAASVRQALASPPPEVTLDFGGLERAGELLAGGLR
ncbi:MAG: hypothetical protein DCC58_16665 [Chloroflexi bacterium]|nr:MAG: hypothetical protein DCC58_16665 [Chloroflexota bacterium]